MVASITTTIASMATAAPVLELDRAVGQAHSAFDAWCAERKGRDLDLHRQLQELRTAMNVVLIRF